MTTSAQSPIRICFDSFEVDLRSGEVWKKGARLRLQEQPFQVLRMLLEHPGEIVSREELRQLLWAADTFVDFDDGLNTAVKKIRNLLGDSVERPRYIETIPRRGYRFLAPIRAAKEAGHVSSPPLPMRRVRGWAAAAIVAIAVGLALFLWHRRAASPASGAVRAIAVLPLENLSGDPSQDYFAAGVTDSLTTELARTVGSSLRVTSRTSAEKYKNKPLRQIAQELHVDAVIEGSVVKSGDRARITAQLINARADKHLWAASYDRDLHDIFALEGEIAATIARQVQITLTPHVQARISSAVAVDPQAYDFYQRGRYRAFSNNPQELAQAISDLQRAIGIEPNFAVAHALLARAYVTEAFMGEPEQQALDAKAMEELNRALQLDPDLADAYLARGILYWTHRNGFPHERAIREFKHALELDPSLTEAHHELAKVFLHVGLLERAEQEIRTALELEPTNVGLRYRIGVALLDQGKPQDAMADLEGTRIFAPDLWTYQKAFALFQLGRKQEAAAVVHDYLRDNQRDQGGVGNAMQALLYADARQDRLAEQSIRAAIEKGKNFGHFHHAAYTIGASYALMDRPADALHWLRSAADDGFPCYPLFERDHSLDKLRQDAQFQQFMTDLKQRWEHYKSIS